MPQEEKMGEKLKVKPPFKRGFNFSRWFEFRTVKDIPQNKYGRGDFEKVKALGVDHIRLPMRVNDFSGGRPDWKLDPLYLGYLDPVLDWAEETGLYLLLDNHTFNNKIPDGKDVHLEEALCRVWTQLVGHCRNRGPRIMYEIFNEPHGIDDAAWGKIQGKVIEAIREVDAAHTIIVGGTNYNSIGSLDAIPEYPDGNLIYTFHYYDPHVFTHQGNSWDTIPLTSLGAVPFPFDAARMPELPADLKGTGYEEVFASYGTISAAKTMENRIAQTVNFANKRGVPVFCGEFGVYMKTALREDRVRWHQQVIGIFDSMDIPWTIWEWDSAFGVFKTSQGGEIPGDLDPEIIKALGLHLPG
jgi:endoglucanase